MMTSNQYEAYVWIWLPKNHSPVVAGKIASTPTGCFFTYAQSYRHREQAISLSPFELPLRAGTFQTEGIKDIFSCIRDACPDAWGRRLIEYQHPNLNPTEIDFALLSGSNRIGALDFQRFPDQYLPRGAETGDLSIIENIANYLEKDIKISTQISEALLHGTSIGGARPKCLLTHQGQPYIAKFSLSSDPYPFIQAEYIAMRLAHKAGIHAAKVELKHAYGRDILLVHRFDRLLEHGQIYRRHMLSALSLLNLSEMEARYASYLTLAEIIRYHFPEPTLALQELFSRIVFNILIGNTDDHARNHAVFYNGQAFELTPAYDITPQIRAGQEATQAMAIQGEQGNHATLRNILSVHKHFLLTQAQAQDIINQQRTTLMTQWQSVCDEANLPQKERDRLWGSVVMSRYCLQGWRD